MTLVSDTGGVKASELIAAIRENIAKHGDIEIVVATKRDTEPLNQLSQVSMVFGAIEELGENWPTYDKDGNVLVIQTHPAS